MLQTRCAVLSNRKSFPFYLQRFTLLCRLDYEIAERRKTASLPGEDSLDTDLYLTQPLTQLGRLCLRVWYVRYSVHRAKTGSKDSDLSYSLKGIPSVD